MPDRPKQLGGGNRIAPRAARVLVATLVALALAPAAAIASQSLSGTITNGHAVGVGFASVWLYVQANDGSFVSLAQVTADSSGNYTFSSLNPGTYKVQASGPDPFVSAYYGQPESVETIDFAAVIVISSSDRTNIDVALPIGGHIAGKLIDAVSGAPVAGLHVEADQSLAAPTPALTGPLT